MSKDDFRELLRGADRLAGRPARVRVEPSEIRRRAKRRRIVRIVGPVAAAAAVVLAAGIWHITLKTDQTKPRQERIASLEDQIRQLRARTDATMNLIQEVLEAERRRQRLDELEAELASIPDPLEEIEKQVDKTAFILVYQADRLYRELNETESAVKTYKRVIKLFPRNQWATVARERLSEIENKRI
jgi:Tfp pilus assembly protein PilN